MIVTGYILAFLGCIAALAGEILMLAVAYRRGIGWLLGCIFLAPIFWIVLLAVQFKTVARPFGIAMAGVVLVALGGLMAGTDFFYTP